MFKKERKRNDGYDTAIPYATSPYELPVLPSSQRFGRSIHTLSFSVDTSTNRLEFLTMF
jgi:hypothetical protein